MSGPCAVGIGVLLACTAALFVVNTWPAYFLGVLRISQSVRAKVQRLVAQTSIGLLLCTTGGVLLLVTLHPC